MWVEDVYYYDSKVHQRQKTDTEYAADLARFIENRPIKAIYIDPSAASFKLEIMKHNISNLYDAENEVLDGIRLVSKYLNNGTLKICKNCEHLIKEFQSYVWDPKCAQTGVDKPMKQSDHCLSGDTIVLTDKGYVRIDSLVGTEGKIASSYSLQMSMENYTEVRLTQKQADIYEIELEDGTKIKATKEHKFLTESGWKELQYLTLCDMLYTWNTNSFKTYSFIKISKQVIGSLLGVLKKGCTWLFGNSTTVRYQKDSTYTI
jgi:hypothetical protein